MSNVVSIKFKAIAFFSEDNFVFKLSDHPSKTESSEFRLFDTFSKFLFIDSDTELLLDDRSVYVITMVESGKYFNAVNTRTNEEVTFLSKRLVGIFLDEREAVSVILDNVGDIHEMSYDIALIDEYRLGALIKRRHFVWTDGSYELVMDGSNTKSTFPSVKESALCTDSSELEYTPQGYIEETFTFGLYPNCENAQWKTLDGTVISAPPEEINSRVVGYSFG